MGDEYFAGRELLATDGFEGTRVYFAAVLVTAFVGIVLAAVSCCCLIPICFGKFILKHKACLPSEKMRFSGKKSQKVFKGIILISCIICLIAILFGFVGNGIVSGETRGFATGLINSVNEVSNASSRVIAGLVQIQPFPELVNLRNGTLLLKEDVDDVADLLYDFDTLRLFAMYLGLFFAMVAVAIGIGAAWFYKQSLGNAWFILGFLSVWWVGWLWAFHLPVSIFSTDVCKVIKNNVEIDNSTVTPLEYFITCLEPEYYNGTVEGEIRTTQMVLDDLNITTTRALNYSFSSAVPSGTPEDRLKALGLLVDKVGNDVEASLSRASQVSQADRDNITRSLEKLAILLDVAEDLYSIVTCEAHRTFFLGQKDHICVYLRNGAILVNICAGFITVVLLIVALISVFAANRMEETKKEEVPLLVLEAMCVVHCEWNCEHHS
jgi:hypothetical protein